MKIIEKYPEYIYECKIQRGGRKIQKPQNSVACRELICCDICTPEGMKEERDKDLFSTICSGLVQNSAEILEEMLNEQKSR